MFYILLKIFIFPFIKLIWIDKINGTRNIPKRGGVIIASNHESYFDFITLYSIFPRRIYFLTGEIFFQKWQWRWIVKLTKQIKVDRNSKDKSESIKQVLNHLKKGDVIGIFPEGTRSADGKLQKAYPGVIKLALQSSCPVIPIGIKGTFEIMSRHKKLPKLIKKCEIKIGKPIYIDRNQNIDNDLKKLMNIIGELCGEQYNY